MFRSNNLRQSTSSLLLKNKLLLVPFTSCTTAILGGGIHRGILRNVSSLSSPSSSFTAATSIQKMIPSIVQQQLLLQRHMNTNSSGSESDNTDSSSHDDFGPVKKKLVAPSASDKYDSDNEKKVHDMIQGHIKENLIMLYMKGNPKQPQCGFSATVVNILNTYKVDYSSVNVLEYPNIRNGIKTFSSWPTVPQLYVKGEFIGGCDIIQTMHTNGELEELLSNEEKS